MAGPSSARRTRVERLLEAVTRRAVAHPWLFLWGALAVLVASCVYASGLKVRGSFVYLLPDEDPTGQRFTEALERKSGAGSTLNIVVESPDTEANERFVDAITTQLKALPEGMILRAEKGPEEIRTFFEKWRWLFADPADLELVECELSKERAENDPNWLGLDTDCDALRDARDRAAYARELRENPLPPNFPPAPSFDEARKINEANKAPEEKKKEAEEKEGTTPIETFEKEMEARIAKIDRFPSGYYRNDEGTQYMVRITAPGGGLGDFGSDEVLARTKAIVEGEDAASYHPEMSVGYAGSIPNSIAERDALINDIFEVSVLALSLILLSIVLYFRTPIVLFHIGLCMGTGTAIAFAAAMAMYGHLNAATSFLVAIVAGNGINHGIVYLARYREERASGKEREEALVAAALAVRKGTWLAALAASGAFGCLLITSFRGFSQFGLIGGVGMIACWLATFTILPASVSALERVFDPAARRDEGLWARLRGSLAAFAERAGMALGRASQRFRWPIVGLAVVLAAGAAYPLPSYLSDPWEYDFSKLGSKRSQAKGAGNWSTKAALIVGIRGVPVMILADEMDQVLDLQAQIEKADAEDPDDVPWIEKVETIHDRLGGRPEVVEDKLELLSQIRDHIDRARGRLSPEQQKIADAWRPPDHLRQLKPEDLPDQLLDLYRENDGTIGTPIYAYLNRWRSQSKGENMMAITAILEQVRLPDGSIAPNASQATVFASMIRAMERDAPRATLAALLLVVLITLAVTRRFVAAASVLGALLTGILLTVGGASWLGVRLNFLNFVAIPLTFGICVEYAVNLYERMLVQGDVAKGISSAGGPVALCSLTTIVGYGALLAADNRALISFGKYAIAGEIACITTALFVLPAVLQLLGGNAAIVAARKDRLEATD